MSQVLQPKSVNKQKGGGLHSFISLHEHNFLLNDNWTSIFWSTKILSTWSYLKKLKIKYLIMEKLSMCGQGFNKSQMLNPKFHWLHQIATTLRNFHWQFWIFLDAIAKAKKLIYKSIAQNQKPWKVCQTFCQWSEIPSYLVPLLVGKMWIYFRSWRWYLPVFLLQIWCCKIL